MGNQNLIKINTHGSKSHRSPLKNELQILYECQQGDVAQCFSTPIQYFIRELSFGNSQAMQKTLQQLQVYKQKNQQAITNLIEIQNICIKTMCGTEYKLRLIFQFSTLSINDEVDARKKTMKYLDFVDCCRVIIGCVEALYQIEKQVQFFGFLAKNGVYNRVFAHPQRILLMGTGAVKMISPLIVSPYDRLQHKNSCYYSPEKLIDFDYNQDQKCALFQLGITLLHVLTLNSCKDIYNGFQVKQDQIDIKINKVWQLYCDSLVCQILSKMTRNDRSKRASMQQCIFLIKNLQQKLSRIIKQMQQQQNQIIAQQFSGLQLSSQTYQSRQVSQNKQNEINYNTSLKYSQSFAKSLQPYSYLSVSNSKEKSKSKKKHRLSLCSDYLSNMGQSQRNRRFSLKNICQKQQYYGKIHQCTNNFGNTEALSYHSSQNYQDAYNLQPMHVKQLRKAEQSCIVVNQQPLFNIVQISNASFSNNVASKIQESSVQIFQKIKKLNKSSKHASKQTINIKNGKQSYHYGNQLSQGIIFKDNKENVQPNTYGDMNLSLSSKMDIEPNRHVYTQIEQDQQNMQQCDKKLLIFNQTTQFLNAEKNKTKKFLWKRTQFNKKIRRSISGNNTMDKNRLNQIFNQNYQELQRQPFHHTYNLQQINQLMKTNRFQSWDQHQTKLQNDQRRIVRDKAEHHFNMTQKFSSSKYI